MFPELLPFLYCAALEHTLTVSICYTKILLKQSIKQAC